MWLDIASCSVDVYKTHSTATQHHSNLSDAPIQLFWHQVGRSRVYGTGWSHHSIQTGAAGNNTDFEPSLHKCINIPISGRKSGREGRKERSGECSKSDSCRNDVFGLLQWLHWGNSKLCTTNLNPFKTSHPECRHVPHKYLKSDTSPTWKRIWHFRIKEVLNELQLQNILHCIPHHQKSMY